MWALQQKVEVRSRACIVPTAARHCTGDARIARSCRWRQRATTWKRASAPPATSAGSPSWTTSQTTDSYTGRSLRSVGCLLQQARVLLIGNVLQVLNHLRLHTVLAERGSEVRLGVKSSRNGEKLGLHNNVTLGQAVDEVQHVVNVVRNLADGGIRPLQLIQVKVQQVCSVSGTEEPYTSCTA